MAQACVRCGSPLPGDSGPCPRCAEDGATRVAGPGPGDATRIPAPAGADAPTLLSGAVPPMDPTVRATPGNAPTVVAPRPGPGTPPATLPAGAAPPPPRTAETDSVGLPDRYRVIRFLGRGGMGRVYHCRDERLDVDVAVKVLPPEVSGDAAAVAQIEKEARASAKFRSVPGILSLFGFEEHRGTHFLVMELAKGGALSDLLKASGRLPEAECRRLGAETAEALAHAHRDRVLHRDIKPANILLTEDRRVKVADFGIARVLSDTASKASQVTVSGTPVYMAPEIMFQQTVDARADLYSLGCMLFELATGERPFAGSMLEIAMMKTSASAPPTLPPGPPPTMPSPGLPAPTPPSATASPGSGRWILVGAVVLVLGGAGAWAALKRGGEAPAEKTLGPSASGAPKEDDAATRFGKVDGEVAGLLAKLAPEDRWVDPARVREAQTLRNLAAGEAKKGDPAKGLEFLEKARDNLQREQEDEVRQDARDAERDLKALEAELAVLREGRKDPETEEQAKGRSKATEGRKRLLNGDFPGAASLLREATTHLQAAIREERARAEKGKVTAADAVAAFEGAAGARDSLTGLQEGMERQVADIRKNAAREREAAASLRGMPRVQALERSAVGESMAKAGDEILSRWAAVATPSALEEMDRARREGREHRDKGRFTEARSSFVSERARAWWLLCRLRLEALEAVGDAVPGSSRTLTEKVSLLLGPGPSADLDTADLERNEPKLAAVFGKAWTDLESRRTTDEAARRCKPCEATGDCPTCKGSGRTLETCRTCGGKPVLVNCPDCKTTKRAPCPTCHGAEYWEKCPNCEGNVQKECGQCKDSRVKGKQKCKECDGDGKKECGYLHNTVKVKGKCKLCGGDGTIKCDACEKGWVPCENCGGDGVSECKKCKANPGRVKGTCPQCAGNLTVDCTRCNSEGKVEGKCANSACERGQAPVDCPTCGGNKRCKDCGGEGRK